METVNFSGDPVARFSKYTDYQHEGMLRRRQENLMSFRKAKKYQEVEPPEKTKH
ncbi:MAG TPA: hypothetical protein VK203_11945 [Nostocaceae cyanobacterium]|nr:hypothetical protein [Nostocaceae cyanobacterium]